MIDPRRTLRRTALARVTVALGISLSLIAAGCAAQDSLGGDATALPETSATTTTSASPSPTVDRSATGESPESAPPSADPGLANEGDDEAKFGAANTGPATTGAAAGRPPPATFQSDECVGPGPVLRADIDQNGRLDQVTIVGRTESDRAVAICGVAPQALRYPIGVDTRYLAAVDLDDDGTTELLVGTKNDDAVGEFVHADIAVWTWTGSALEPVLRESGDPLHLATGQNVRELRGIGCVDLDDDDRREIFDLTSELNDTEAAWTRTVYQLDGTTATSLQTDTGTYLVGEDDYSIDLLRSTSCGNDIITYDQHRPPVAFCAATDSPNHFVRTVPDVDGDGVDDVLYEYPDPDGTSWAGVCAANGDQDHFATSMGGGIGVIDLDGDGLLELSTSGTAASYGGTWFYRFEEGLLRPIVGPDMQFGLIPVQDSPDIFASWGCADRQGNSLRELVQGNAWLDGVVYRYRLTIYEVRGLALVEVDEITGELVTPVTDDGGDILSAAAQEEFSGLLPPDCT